MSRKRSNVTSITDSALHKEAAKAAAAHAFKTEVRGFAFRMFEKIEQHGATRAALREMLVQVNRDISQTVRAMAEHGAASTLCTRLALDATLLATMTGVAMSDAPGFGTPALRVNLEERFSAELETLEPIV